jgi:hypothetical protein
MFFAVAMFFYRQPDVNPATEAWTASSRSVAARRSRLPALLLDGARIRSRPRCARAGLGDARGDAGLADADLGRDLLVDGWDFTWGRVRLLVYLLCAVFVFGVKLNVASPRRSAAGMALTLCRPPGSGCSPASFILYFKRGDPINFSLPMGRRFFGNVFFPSKLLPAGSSGCPTGCP